MGMVVSAVVGIALTLPISSAAICAAIGISGGAVLTALSEGTVSYEIWNGLALAGGAATAGCCAHMLGFAILSYPDNGIGGFVAQGLGTSMLQIPEPDEETDSVASASNYIPDYRSAVYLPVRTSQQRCSDFFRYGYFRSGRSDRNHDRMDEYASGIYGSRRIDTGYAMAGANLDLFRASSCDHMDHRTFLPRKGLDQTRRSED